ncbi:MAG TPA: hypothetical protein PKZ92_03260 [Candidatus Woesebacteria bacterium]|nr:hypothetical protein [Candidatus Shapirobacteria bacterium]HOR02249.1 hypothetical protein [Candidatus Woesebacteria bacterium]
MERLINRFKKVTVSMLVMVFGVVIFFWELNYLGQVSEKKDVSKVLGESKVLDLTIVGLEDNVDQIKVRETIASEDARPVIIRKYLEKYKSPLAPYSDLIYQISNDYGFEYYWIVAIAQQESNLCKKIPEGSHNCWGYGIHKRGTLKFENYELAIKSYANYLKREYFDKGLNTPELIMKKYCPGSNGSWAKGVWQFINEMENGDF